MENATEMMAYSATHTYMYFLAPVWTRISVQLVKDVFSDELVEMIISLYIAHTDSIPALYQFGSSAISLIGIEPALEAYPFERKQWITRWIERGGIPSIFQEVVSPSIGIICKSV